MNILLGPIQLNQSSPDVLVIMAVLHCGLRIHTWRLLLHLFSYFLPSVCGALEKSIRHGSIKTGHGRRIHVGKQKKYASYIYILYIFFSWSIRSIVYLQLKFLGPAGCCRLVLFWFSEAGFLGGPDLRQSMSVLRQLMDVLRQLMVVLRYVYGLSTVQLA